MASLVASALASALALQSASLSSANFRAATLGDESDFYALAVSGMVSFVLLLLGCLYFRRVESSFADRI